MTQKQNEIHEELITYNGKRYHGIFWTDWLNILDWMKNHTNRNSFTRTNGTAHSSNYVLCLSIHQSNQPNSEPYKSHWKTHLTHWKTPQFRREIFRHRVTKFEPSTDSIRAVLTEKMSKLVVLDRELKVGRGADYGNSQFESNKLQLVNLRSLIHQPAQLEQYWLTEKMSKLVNFGRKFQI